jgi:hypothetical protein
VLSGGSVVCVVREVVGEWVGGRATYCGAVCEGYLVLVSGTNVRHCDRLPLLVYEALSY